VSVGHVHPGRHIVGGTALVFLAEGLLLPTGLLTAAFLTRRLGPDDYGLFVLATAIVAWIEWTVTSIFSRPTIKFVADVDDWRPVGATALRLHLVVGCGAALFLFLAADLIGLMFAEPALAGYLRLFALEIPIFALAHAHRNILIGLGSFGARALTSAGRWIVRLVLVFLLVELGLSVSGAILASIGATVIELAIGRWCIRPSLRRASFPVRDFFGFAVPLFLFAVSLRLFDKLDLFALKALGGSAADAGIYGAAQNLSVLPGVFALSFTPLLLSSLSRALRGADYRQAHQLARNSLRATLVLLPLAGLLAGAAPEIVVWIFGTEFSDSAPLLAVLGFASVALVVISTATAILTAAGKPGWTCALVGPLLPLALAGHLLLIPSLGSIGAALVTTLLAMVGALASVIAVHRIWGILPPLSTLGRSALLAFVAYGLAATWPEAGPLLLVKLTAVALCILLLFIMLKEFSRDEIALARSFLPGWFVRQRLGRGHA